MCNKRKIHRIRTTKLTAFTLNKCYKMCTCTYIHAQPKRAYFINSKQMNESVRRSELIVFHLTTKLKWSVIVLSRHMIVLWYLCSSLHHWFLGWISPRIWSTSFERKKSVICTQTISDKIETFFKSMVIIRLHQTKTMIIMYDWTGNSNDMRKWADRYWITAKQRLNGKRELQPNVFDKTKYRQNMYN